MEGTNCRCHCCCRSDGHITRKMTGPYQFKTGNLYTKSLSHSLNESRSINESSSPSTMTKLSRETRNLERGPKSTRISHKPKNYYQSLHVNLIKSWIRIALILIVVPTEINSTLQPERHKFQLDHVNNQVLQQQRDVEWAKRLTMPGQNGPATGFETNLVADMRNHNYQPMDIVQTSIPARSILSTNPQGAGVIKHLINNTLANLVSQSGARMAQLQQQSYLANSSGNNRILPKLYSFLFPSNLQQHEPFPTASQVTNMGQIEPSLGNNRYNQDKQTAFANHKPAGTMTQDKPIINLSAPYETIPRAPLVGPHSRLENSEQTSASNMEAHNIGQWRDNTMTYELGNQSDDDSVAELEASSAVSGELVRNMKHPSVSKHHNPEEMFSSSTTKQPVEDGRQMNELELMHIPETEYSESFGGRVNEEHSTVQTPDTMNNNLAENLTEHTLDNESNLRGQQDDEEQTGEQSNGFISEQDATNIANSDLTGNQREIFAKESSLPDDDNFLTSQLPSQYDAVIREPPEGHYDDYFKPSSTDLALQPSSFLLSNQEDNITEVALNSSRVFDHHHQNESQFELEDHVVNATESPSRHRLNHNYQSNSSSYLPTGWDYTKQFYMNQQPLRQKEAAGDQNVEFMAPNKSSNNFNFEQPGNIVYETIDPMRNGSQLTSENHRRDLQNMRNLSIDANEDNIQLIIANTNSSQPDNEKVIHYTSEGHNLTGSSPRETFFNKDMNESPPPDDYSTDSPVSNEPEPSEEELQPEEAGRVLDEKDDLRRLNSDERNQNKVDPSEKSHTGGVLDHVDSTSRAPANTNISSSSRLKHRNDHPRQRNLRPKSKGRHPHPDKQQPLRRPSQITEVKFDPKELVVRQPDPPESKDGNIVESISEIPSKVKRLRQNQPDKNELMNELLTALDRVKVAIYKLQPLTAKMNAIYRKSVTSNTRDIIMDNHKGTYARRYPPGDYDDSYDKIQSTDMLAHDRKSNQRNRRSSNEPSASESMVNPIYLPVPQNVRDGLQKHNQSGTSPKGQLEFQPETLSSVESEIVATGIGRRLSGGRVKGQLSVSSGDKVLYDNDEHNLEDRIDRSDHRFGNSEQTTAIDSAAPSFVPIGQLVDESNPQSPLFGYRITIYQSPEGDEDLSANEQFSYQLEGGDQDLMVTSESSVQPELVSNVNSGLQSDGSDEEPLDEGESKTKKEQKKKMEHEKGSKKKKSSESTDKKKEKSKKSEMRNRKMEEESKKKKEYKKIKHNKGVVSKEKKSMHRDKHVKAHDRGAAKEKALKERTQIEFFEREQIVDDEFEKGKKSTLKAGWQVGHDSKKSTKQSSDEPLSMGGSHYVKHEPKEMHMQKGHGSGSEASSSKKSNKFEKKSMEAKGKKFKGWREKGYKIITETEFIDRGSLHDSAYKKRDKGAAQHHKFKKMDSSSEGHHGSMVEQHKKKQKKEEKKSKMNEKKEKHSKHNEKKKEMNEKKKELKEKKNKKKASHVERRQDDDGLDGKESAPEPSKQHSPLQTVTMALNSTTFQLPATSVHQVNATGRPMSLIRLLNANHDELVLSGSRPIDNSTLSISESLFLLNNQNTNRNPAVVSSYPKNDSMITSTMRPFLMHQNLTTLLDKGNATVLNIVDNFTGRQINTTRIGTYEVDDHYNIRLSINGSQPTKMDVVSPTKTTSVPVGRPGGQIDQKTVSTTTTTLSPSNIHLSTDTKARDTAEASLLMNLLRNSNYIKHPTSYSMSSSEQRLPIGQLDDQLDFLTQDQVNAAAELLGLVQPSGRSIKEPNRLMDIPESFHQLTLTRQPIIPAAYRHSFAPSPLNFGSSPQFNPNHYIDYEHDMASPLVASNTFITD